MATDLLIVDDEAAVRRVLSVTLTSAGFSVAEASSGEEALSMLGRDDYALMLLDSNLPGLSGRSVCKEVRRRVPALPVIMLTVRDSEQDKVDAFNAGADDYVTKPFGLRELTARVHALLRRSRKAVATEEEIKAGDLILCPSRLSVRLHDKEIRLTPIQYKIVERLAANNGKTVPYRVLLASVWGANSLHQIHYLRVFIRQLRVLIEQDPADPKVLITVQHIGYRFGSSSHAAIPARFDFISYDQA